ncbi:fibrous sheath-interacting protein 2 [Melanaphis sacchari]|uniref:fibrous sheath-interacting protein 2 n=1 Tax=Melanaphis sacchari TaxID=742174 RepID=UPI000DC13B35|nr:fibrous sheath-interacting protein 2 [Melanaphis sacchari]
MLCGTQEKPLPIFKKKWRPAKICDRTTLLAIRRPTAASKFRDSVPRPNYRPLKICLPSWESRKLDEKIPMYHGYTPSGPIVFHRGLMGKDPFQSDIKLSFMLNNLNEIAHRYNPLHDPHLKHWVNSPINRKFLQKQGLITEDKDVICSLSEYNEYRRFLLCVHNDLIAHKLKLKKSENEDRNKIAIANFNHRKELIKKLNLLKYDKSKNKPQNVTNKRNHVKPICKLSNKERKLPFKKIETYTIFGSGLGGLIDQNKYKRTFIKGSPNDYYLLGLFDDFFKQQKDAK